MDDRPLSWQRGMINLLFVPLGLGVILTAAGMLMGDGPVHHLEMIGIGLVLTVPSIAGIALLYQSDGRARQKAQRFSMLLAGAFDIVSGQRRSEVVALSYGIARDFGIRRAPDDPPIDPSELTAGDISDWLFARVQWDGSNGRLFVDPRGVAGLLDALRACGCMIPADGVRLNTPVGAIVQRGRRLRRLWTQVQDQTRRYLPSLVLPALPMVLGGIAALALTLGTFVPLMIWLGHGGRMDDAENDAGFYAALHALARFSFFGMLFIYALLMRALLMMAFASPPESCRSVGQMVILLAPSTGVTDTTWTAETVWIELRAIVAEAHGCSAKDITLDTPLLRSVGMPVIMNT